MAKEGSAFEPFLPDEDITKAAKHYAETVEELTRKHINETVKPYFSEEMHTGLEKWLKERRDEIQEHDSYWTAIDDLLNEARDCGAMGFLPWSDENRAYRERDN